MACHAVFLAADDDLALSIFESMPEAVVGGILLVAILASVYPAAVLRKYIRIVMNILNDQAPPPGQDTRDVGQLEGEVVSFRARDGLRLEGVLVPGQTDNGYRGVIIFAHEFGSDRRSCSRYCNALLRAGYDVFAFDFRGHGASGSEEGYRPRQLPSDREEADMLGAIAFVQSHLEEECRVPRIGVFGISRGAGAAILASVGIESVRAIVTDGAYCNDTILEYYMKRFARIFAKIRIVAENHPPAFWRFLRWLLLRECRRRFKCSFPSVRKAAIRIGKKPILLVHGEKDSYIPVRQSQILYDILAGPKKLWIVPDARHNHSIMVRTKEYGDRVVRFFDEHLGVCKAPTPTPATAADASPWADAPLESLASVDESRTADEPSVV